MNYRTEFEQCFSYIEAHLKADITVMDMADEMGYSVYHFCRIFYAYQGMTPMEYVRARRLQAAFAEVSEGRKIIDIAYDYKFETPSGFSKAFKNKYGMPPLQMKKRLQGMKDNSGQEGKDIPVTYVIKELEAFYVCGYCTELDFSSGDYGKDMVAYWETYDENNIEERLYCELNPNKHGEIGIIIRDSEDSTKHNYLLGIMAEGSKHNSDWITYQIPAGKYAVITCPPVDMTSRDCDLAKMVKEVWKYIFTKWLDSVDYRYDESREAFEYYDERCHYRTDAVMDIYIPIL